MTIEITKKEDLIVPQVFAGLIRDGFTGKMVVANLANFSDELVGTAGDSVTFPKWALLGNVEDLVEGEALSIEKMKQTSHREVVKMQGKAIQLTDIGLMSSIGDPLTEASSQFAELFARAVDSSLIEKAKTAPLFIDVKKIELLEADILKALEKFGDSANAEDFAGIVVHSKYRNSFYNMPMFTSVDKTMSMDGNGIQRKGLLGMFMGIPVYVSDKDTFNIATGEATTLLIKKNSLAVIMKRDFETEVDRDILKKATTVASSIVYATALTNEAGIVVIKHKL